jgi:hypothetical protein
VSNYHLIKVASHVVDVVAVGVATAAWVQILPPMAAVFSIIWIVYQFTMDQLDRAEQRRKAEQDRRGADRRLQDIPVEVDRRIGPRKDLK